VINLLVKDFKLQFFSGENTKKKLLGLIIRILLAGALALVVTFIFTQVMIKVSDYDRMMQRIAIESGTAVADGIDPYRAVKAYMTLFLAIISVIMIVLNVVRAYKLFFNDKDVEILIKMPVSNTDIILSKLIVIFVSHIVTSFIFVFPLFVAYYLQVGGSPRLYFVAVFYTFLSFLLEAGIALIIVYPFKLIVDYLKKHILIQFIIALVLMLGMAALYARVLNVFMDMVVNRMSDSSSVIGLFTPENIENVIRMTNIVPLIYLIQFYFSGLRNVTFLVRYIFTAGGIFLVGLAISVFAFNFFRNIRFQSKKRIKKGGVKVSSVNKALIKKELILLFKDSNNMFSFSALLIVSPILMYLVVYAINGVFSNGTFSFIALIIKDIIPLIDIVLIMLFTTIISSGASNYISNERRTMKILKTIPISPFKQLLFKVLVPFTLSAISLLISAIVLLITRVVTFNTLIFGFILSIMLLVLYMLASLKEEMKIRNEEKKNTTLSTLFAYVVPIIFLLVSIIISYLEYNVIYAYLITMGVILLMVLPFVINMRKKIDNDFLDLEVIN